LEVAAAVVRCGGYKEAASALGIAYGTLAKTLGRLMERRGAHSTASLAARLMAYPEFDRLVGPKQDWLP
jgi:DNA-binding CsgD family transcriptional regulator